MGRPSLHRMVGSQARMARRIRHNRRWWRDNPLGENLAAERIKLRNSHDERGWTWAKPKVIK